MEIVGWLRTVIYQSCMNTHRAGVFFTNWYDWRSAIRRGSNNRNGSTKTEKSICTSFWFTPALFNTIRISPKITKIFFCPIYSLLPLRFPLHLLRQNPLNRRKNVRTLSLFILCSSYLFSHYRIIIFFVSNFCFNPQQIEIIVMDFFLFLFALKFSFWFLAVFCCFFNLACFQKKAWNNFLFVSELCLFVSFFLSQTCLFASDVFNLLWRCS